MAILRILLLIVFSLSVLMGTSLLHAQDSGTSSPVTKPVSPTDNRLPEVGLPAGKADVLLRTETGELVPLRDLLGDQVINELLQRGMEQRSVPQYTIARQELTSVVDHDEVTTKMELQIQVHAVDEWVTIPLAFGDVYVTEFEHKSDVPRNQGLLTTGEQNTRQWHLFGAGLHRITLGLIGKTKSLAPGVRQLSLNLPASTASHADIRFSGPVELQPLPAGSVDKPTRDDQGVRSVEFWGLSETFSVSWSDVVQRVTQKPVIQVQNRMKLDLTTIPVNLTVAQQLQVSGSPISELRVTFPEGFQLQKVDARNSSGISVFNNFERASASGTAADSSEVTALVRLTTPTEGQLTLSFDLELTNRTFPQDIRVALPSIHDANVQSGDLDILFPSGLLVQQTVVEGAQRKRVTSETDLSVAATAFRMRSTESQIVLHVEETEAQIAVTPDLTLQPDLQNVILTARYEISVLTGSLLDLSVYWPGCSSGEWQILPGTTRLVSGKTSTPLSLQPSETEPDVLQCTFRERQSGEFLVQFRAIAPLTAVRSGDIQLHCPEIQGQRGQRFLLTTIESDEYSIRPISMGTGEPLPTAPSPVSTSGMAINSGLKSECWLHDDASIPIRLELPEQAPSVTADISLGMQPRGSGIEVLETIGFEIEHRDLTSLSLSVPTGIRPTVRISGQDEILHATYDSSETHWSFRLPEARRGRLTFDVRYLWPPAAANDPLPLILPDSAEVRSIEVGTGSGSGLTVQDRTSWQPVYSEEFDAAWYTGKPVTSVPVHRQQGMALTPADSPDLLLAQTQIIGNQSLTTTLAIYETLPDVIKVETPLNAVLDAILIDEQSLTSEEALRRRDVQREKSIERGIWIWQIQTKGAEPGAARANQTGPHVVEIRISNRLPQNSSLWLTAKLERPIIEGESSSVPVIWCTGSQDEFQTASASSDFVSLTRRGMQLLPWGESARSLLDRQLKGILSPYSADIQELVLERLNGWMTLSDHHDLFFGAAESPTLPLRLIPFASLLLISASICVVVFVILSLLRQMTIILPVLLVGCTSLVAWLIVPEWTSLLAPYAAMGVLFGIVSVTFQRLISDRRIRFPKASQVGNYPTVFGYSGMMSHSVGERSEPLAASSGTKSDFNMSSFV